MKTENFWEKIIIETASNSIKSIVVICLSALAVVLLEIYNPLAAIYSAKVSKTIQLLLPLSLLLLLLLSISYILHLRKKLKIELKFSCGVYWDKYLNTYCPSCKKNLTNYGFYGIGNFQSRAGFKCLSCDKTIHLSDGKKVFMNIDEAKTNAEKLFNN